MLKRLTPRERFEQLITSYEPILRAAFMAAVDDIRSNIVLRRIVERLEKGDISGAIDAMFIEEAAFNPLEEALRQAFNAGGVDTVSNMPTLKDPDGYAIVIRWDARNVAAESWLLDHSSYLVTNIISDQREAIRTTLTESLARGDNPTKAAKAIVGPVNRATGRREGGILGLTSQQAQFVQNARDELLSGDSALLRNYLERGRRDKRFDRTIAKAIRDGKALTADQVEKITGRYAAGLLKLRADTIALNETFQAMAAAKDMAFRQQIENGNLSAGVVTKTWRHTPQEHGRLQHIAMNGQKVGYDQPFVAPDGTQIMYPHAPGTPARHAIGCKCVCEYSIDHVANLING
ncbi:head morphogenesis protein [Agrobacterium sp. S2]|nr:head morphogenesis protein [Agrobacterium sp. S2]